jgi:S-adenosylmethionine-dependent methyltransferase
MKSETTADSFTKYQQTIASRLRYRLAQHFLEDCHDLSRPLKVLDAGGGNGLNAEAFLARGHHVTILDADPEMLERARARLQRLNLLERCHFVEGRVEAVAEVLAAARFDLILCHHVLEYIDDGLRVLASMAQVAAPQADLSLITLNPVSEVIRAMIFKHDAAQAESKLSDLAYDARWFGDARLYELDQITARAEQAGWQLQTFRGLRVLADYVPEQQAVPSEEAILHLEKTLGSLEPFRRIGRYFQFCFRRAER